MIKKRKEEEGTVLSLLASRAVYREKNLSLLPSAHVNMEYVNGTCVTCMFANT